MGCFNIFGHQNNENLDGLKIGSQDSQLQVEYANRRF